MSANASPAPKKSRLGKAMNYLVAFGVLLALTYGGLYKMRTQAWPWEDWNSFADFTSITTKNAYDGARQFTREKVVPATSDLLARAQELLEEWESEPVAADPEAPEGEGEVEGESLKIPAEEEGGVIVVEPADEDEGGVEIISREEMAVEPEGSGATADEPAPAPRKVRPADAPTDLHSQGREKFKEGLRHYQLSSPEMDDSQEQLKAAQKKFQEAQDILERAKAGSPEDRRIEEDLQEVQIFLYDCQKRLTVEETY